MDSRYNLPNQIDAEIPSPMGNSKMHFTWQSPAPGAQRDGAVYRDTEGVLWYLKLDTAMKCVKEVIASQLYRHIAGLDAAPEVRLVKTANNWMVASKWQDNLNTYEYDKPVAGLEWTLVASFIIGDDDAYKNTATLANKIFRYDFGSALNFDEMLLARRAPGDLSSVYQLTRSIWCTSTPYPEKILQCINVSELLRVFKQVTHVNFNWDWWINLYNEVAGAAKEHHPLEEQKSYVLRNIDTLINLSQPVNQEQENDTNKPNHILGQALLRFYQKIEPYVLPLIANYSTAMAMRHFQHLQQTGRQPSFYRWFLDAAQMKIKEYDLDKKTRCDFTGGNDHLFYLEILEIGSVIESNRKYAANNPFLITRRPESINGNKSEPIELPNYQLQFTPPHLLSK